MTRQVIYLTLKLDVDHDLAEALRASHPEWPKESGLRDRLQAAIDRVTPIICGDLSDLDPEFWGTVVGSEGDPFAPDQQF